MIFTLRERMEDKFIRDADLYATSVRLRVKYGFDTSFSERNNQLPYFTITGEVTTRTGRYLTGGCIHDTIVKYMPHLEPLVKWHLVAFPGEPMHYFANAEYWAKQVRLAERYEDRLRYADNFKKTVVFGAVETDNEPFIQDVIFDAWLVQKENVTYWCRERLPALKRLFIREMYACGCLTLDPTNNPPSRINFRDFDDMVRLALEGVNGC